MKKFITVFLCVAMMCALAQPIYAADEPSVWAAFDVNMSSNYELGNKEGYTNYQSPVSAETLNAVMASFKEAFELNEVNMLGSEAEGSEITREVVLTALYQVISEALELTDDNFISYLVANKILFGDGSRNYNLSQVCTTEELLVLSTRVYEHIARSLGKDTTGPFWQVSDGDNTVYLFGSIHLSNKDSYPLNQRVIDAYNKSSVLAVEVDILNIKPEDMTYAPIMGMLPDGESIENLISEELYIKYAAEASKYFEPEVYNRFKVWFATLALQGLMISDTYSGGLGLDMYFLINATQYNKTIFEIETMRYQIDMFNGFSKELQEAQLSGLFAENVQPVEAIGKLTELWREGDPEGLDAALFPNKELTGIDKEYSDALWTVRNKNMTDAVVNMLNDSGKDYFVVVGAGHMVGDDGIVKSLEAKGYTVTHVK